MTRCCKCPLPAIIYQKYSGMHLCQAHFEDDVQRKTRETLRRSGLFAHGLRLALYMDGGKGSVVMASIIKKLFECRRDIDLVAIIIDDCGPGTQAARIACQKLGLAVAIQIPTPIIPKDREDRDGNYPASDPCRFSQKMRTMAGLAQEVGADAIATGHDLDDVATEIFISYLDGDIEGLRYGRQGMRPGRDETSFIPTIQPLRRISGREVRLYALQHGLCFCEGREEDKRHKEARRELSRFDSRHPGTSYSLLRSLEKLDLENRIDTNPLRAKPLNDYEKQPDPVPR